MGSAERATPDAAVLLTEPRCLIDQTADPGLLDSIPEEQGAQPTKRCRGRSHRARVPCVELTGA